MVVWQGRGVFETNVWQSSELYNIYNKHCSLNYTNSKPVYSNILKVTIDQLFFSFSSIHHLVFIVHACFCFATSINTCVSSSSVIPPLIHNLSLLCVSDRCVSGTIMEHRGIEVSPQHPQIPLHCRLFVTA